MVGEVVEHVARGVAAGDARATEEDILAREVAAQVRLVEHFTAGSVLVSHRRLGCLIPYAWFRASVYVRESAVRGCRTAAKPPEKEKARQAVGALRVVLRHE